MSKKRPRKRRVLENQKLTRWNGTKAQSATWKRERDLKNRIFELEQQQRGDLATLADLHATIGDLDRRLLDASPTNEQLHAIQAFAVLPMTRLVELGLVDQAHTLARWVLELEGKPVPQSPGSL